MHQVIRFSLALVGAVVLSAHAGAQGWVWYDVVDGNQEVPPTGSPGFGYTWGSYDAATNEGLVTVHVHGLIGTVLAPPSAAHFHGPAPPGVNAGIQVFLPGNTGGPNDYVIVDHPFTLTAAQEDMFLNGLMYLNIHTTEFPGGEVRGQINPVPEPATLLALAGLGGLAVLRRRKRT